MVRIYFGLKDGYLDGWSSTRSNENDIELTVSKDHEVLRNPEIFKYVDGELIKDEVRQKELIQEATREKPTEEEMLALALMDLAEMIMGGEK